MPDHVRLHELLLRQGSVLDSIRRLHGTRNRTRDMAYKEALMNDLLAANQERIEIEAELRALRRTLASKDTQ